MLNEVKSCNTGRKIISFMHLSLGGFVAGPNGEMNRIKVDEVPKGCSEGVLRTFGKIFDHVGKRISEGDTV